MLFTKRCLVYSAEQANGKHILRSIDLQALSAGDIDWVWPDAIGLGFEAIDFIIREHQRGRAHGR